MVLIEPCMVAIRSWKVGLSDLETYYPRSGMAPSFSVPYRFELMSGTLHGSTTVSKRCLAHNYTVWPTTFKNPI